jgi:endonuclease/exonuclease/phosphatase family metal-dependent hydrolase
MTAEPSSRTVPLRVATFNLRHDTDRYSERKHLLASAFAAMSPDIAALQEVTFGAERQALFLGMHVTGEPYQSFEAPLPSRPGYGNAILCRIGEVQAHERLELSHRRLAHRVLVLLPGNLTLWFANTHLHHRASEPGVRLEQARAICDWMDDAPRADAMVVAGDFNASPVEPAYAEMTRRGYRSASVEANGSEPRSTWPSGLQAPTMDTDGEPATVDYLWLNGAVRATGATIAANEPSPVDSTLYPSDHFAVVAEIVLGA